MNCFICKKSVTAEDFEELGSLCKDCYKKFLPVLNEKKIQNIQRLAESHHPIIKTQENGKPLFACYLPTMIEVAEVKSEKPNEKKLIFNINFGQGRLQRIGNLIGMAGFYYDAEYYFATTPEKVFVAWNWFNQKIETNDDYWMHVEGDIARDFLDNNWKPCITKFIDSLFLDILYLILDMHALYLMEVDVRRKLSEIRNHMRNQIKAYEKISSNVEFSTNYKVSRKALLRVTNLRKILAHLSSESRLAKFAKQHGFDVKMTFQPDLIINGKKIEVKKREAKYVRPEKQGAVTFVLEESTVVEDLSNPIYEGLTKQNVDIVAIEVDHLDKREIEGFYSKWLGPIVDLKKALLNAINYDKKGIVLLFKCRSDGCFGRILRCKKIHK